MPAKGTVSIVAAILAVHACGSELVDTPEPVPILDANATASATTSGPDAAGGEIGAPCDEDIDCKTGSHCIRASDRFPLFDGGPPAGYCTPDCSTDSDCGPGARCVDDAGVRACFLMCTLGTPPLVAFDQWLEPSKCRGREDMPCDTWLGDNLFGLEAPESFCNPMCSSHQQCPSAHYCNFRSGKCVRYENPGAGTGEACVTDEDCEGNCADFGSVAFCTRYCVHGGQAAHWWWECESVDEGICAININSWSGAGDLGYCLPGCSKHSDCLNPDQWCIKMPVIEKGYCWIVPACPNGQAACSGFPGTVCTETPYGPYCIDRSFPVDE